MTRRTNPLPAAFLAGLVAASPAGASLLSTYDRISVSVLNGSEFSSAQDGKNDEGFLVGEDGRVYVPQLGKVQAAGRDEAEVQAELAERLREYIKVPNVSVRLVRPGTVSVDVSGAVYRPGMVTLSADAAQSAREAVSLRTAFHAIRRAGGVRPDADLKGLVVERSGHRLTLAPGQDAPIIDGDRIVVPSLGRAATDAENVPSQLAPEEITVYVSGQDLPAVALGPVKVRPGTPLSGALTAAGATGKGFLRSGRQVTLVRRDPTTNRPRTETFDLDRVVSGETDPKLLQDDAIAVNAGPAADSFGFLNLLSPILTPLTWLLRR